MKLKFLMMLLPCLSVISVRAQVTVNAFSRVFYFESGNRSGTIFAYEHKGEQFLITAQHVVAQLTTPGSIKLRNPQTQKLEQFAIKAVLRCGNPDEPDIAVLVPTDARVINVDEMPLALVTGNINVGQQFFFLGYPLGWNKRSMFPDGPRDLPFLKHATLGAIENIGGRAVFYFDGINNRGFSGSPVLFRDQDNETRVLAIVSSYLNDPLLVKGGRVNPLASPQFVESNSGIIVAHPMMLAVKAIEAYQAEQKNMRTKQLPGKAVPK